MERSMLYGPSHWTLTDDGRRSRQKSTSTPTRLQVPLSCLQVDRGRYTVIVWYSYDRTSNCLTHYSLKNNIQSLWPSSFGLALN
jgi:hypothetical protein